MGSRCSSTPSWFSKTWFSAASKSKWRSTASNVRSSQLWCVGFQAEHPVHGKEGVLQSMSIESGHLQLHRTMSFFQIEATGSKPTSGISISRKAPFVQDLSHHSCVIAILWRALPIQAISRVVLSQQMTSSISAVKFLWRILLSSKGMQRGFSSKQHVFVDGQMAFRTRSWRRPKRSKHGFLEWLVSSIACVECNRHGSSSCKRKLASNHHSHLQLQHKLQHLHRRQFSQHLLAQLQAFQSRQPQYLRIQRIVKCSKECAVSRQNVQGADPWARHQPRSQWSSWSNDPEPVQCKRESKQQWYKRSSYLFCFSKCSNESDTKPSKEERHV